MYKQTNMYQYINVLEDFFMYICIFPCIKVCVYLHTHIYIET